MKLYDIKGLETTRYKITKTGKLWNGKTFLSPSTKYALVVNGKACSYHLDRLLAETFLEIDETRPYVYHIDGNQKNNSLSNLKFVSNDDIRPDEDSTWKYIPGFDHVYMITREGRVKSVGRYTTVVNHGIETYRFVKGKELQIVKGKSSFYVGLSKDNKPSNYSLQNLLASTFIPNKFNRTQVRFVNNDRFDIRLENLMWVDPTPTNPPTKPRKTVKTGFVYVNETDSLYFDLREFIDDYKGLKINEIDEIIVKGLSVKGHTFKKLTKLEVYNWLVEKENIKLVPDLHRYYVGITGNVYNSRTLRKLTPSSEGFIRVMVDKKRSAYVRVSQLVAATFMKPVKDKPYIYNIDGDFSNNAVSNLKFVSNADLRLRSSSTWKTLDGISDEYQISKEGNVRVFDRFVPSIVNSKNPYRINYKFNKSKLLNTTVRNGEREVTLRLPNNKQKVFKVSTLVERYHGK